MGFSSFWHLTGHKTTTESKKRYWLFYASPEAYLSEGGAIDFPGEVFWSCERETKQGDLILVYRKSMDYLSVARLVREFSMAENIAKHVKKSGIGKDFPVIWEATCNAKRKLFWHWPYGCDTKEIQRIDPPLRLAELKSEPRLKRWEGLRWNLQSQGHSALQIRKFAWEIIINMIEHTRGLKL